MTHFAGKNLCWSLFLIKLEFWGPATFLTKTATQVLSCEICKLLRVIILKNICERVLLNFFKIDWTKVFSCEFCELFKSTYFIEDLQTGGSETAVRVSFFNKVASLTAWMLLTVLERDYRTGISLWILRNVSESFISERLLATTSYCFFFLFCSEVCSLK